MADQNKETKAPEEEQAVEKKQAKATKEAAKVYNFTATKKYLSCAGLGIQFMEGKASTTNLEVAKALAKIEGVSLVEE